MKGSGKTITWRELACMFGTTVESTKENIRMIRSMVMAYIVGLMADAMKATGGRVNSMGLAHILCQKKISLSMDFGKTESELNGSRKRTFRK